jgi:NADH-quinone oxidoreductase subunit G
MTDTAPKTEQVVTVEVNGTEIACRPGELVIAAAERAGTYIPRFCYHPRMRPVGMCRMCIVEIDTGRGPALQPACMIPVADGMKVDTESAITKKAQDRVLEFLLINHPLDCPMCDKGGECPLQDQTVAFGPGESRFVEEKRHFEKPIYLSPLVSMDRERCILCDRCTRFQSEVADDPVISFIGRGSQTEVNTFPDHPFASYFSGNTTQICPVGALLPVPYRFKARPWDLAQVESTCTSCSVGCRVAVQSSSDRLVRKLGVDVDPVNHGWLCDKGRFDFEAVNNEDRLRTPLVRSGDDLIESTWGDALRRAADALSGAKERHGAASIGVLGGARLTNEDAYAWSKLARTVLRTDNVDAQLGDGLPAELVLGLPRATIDDVCSADVLVLLTADLKEELPVLFLRVRGAINDRALKVLELSAIDTSMTRYAETSVRYVPGDAAAAVRDDRSRALLQGAGKVVCVLGRPSLAESTESISDAVAALLELAPDATFISGLRRSNVHGALDMGLAPGMLPGRVSLDDGREWFEQAWRRLPGERGLDALGILTAAAEGRLQALVLLGSDPLSDFPDRDLARRALAGAGTVIAVDGFLTASARQADVLLPAAIWSEKPGTTTNLEGRVSTLNQKVNPPGTARADWMIAAELATRLGGDLGLESVNQITDEIAAVAPAYAGIDHLAVRGPAGFDGILAGGLVERERHAPPTMSRADAPEIHSPEVHGDNPTVQELGDDGSAEKPHPEAGDAPAVDVTDDTGDSASAHGGGGVQTDEPARPALVTYAAAVSAERSIPAVDAYSLRLVAAHRLYDAGTLVQAAPSLAPLAPGTTVRVNPTDLERLGLNDGDQVRVTSSRATFTLAAESDLGVPHGIAAIWFDQPGSGAADLIDATAPVTDIRVETI